MPLGDVLGPFGSGVTTFSPEATPDLSADDLVPFSLTPGAALNAVLFTFSAARDEAVAVQLTGTWVGTVTWEASNNNVDWVPTASYVIGNLGNASPSTQASANGLYVVDSSARFVRARVSAYTSGSITGVAAGLKNLPRPVGVWANVLGAVARGAAVSSNPVLMGARGATAQPTAVSNGQTVDPYATAIGALITKPYAIPELEWNASVALTTTTATALQAAAAAGLKRHITAIQAINTGAAVVDLILLDGAAERWRLPLPVNVPVVLGFPTGLVLTAATALNANLSAAGTVRVNAQGYTAP